MLNKNLSPTSDVIPLNVSYKDNHIFCHDRTNLMKITLRHYLQNKSVFLKKREKEKNLSGNKQGGIAYKH